jgi:hypothetical protein
MRYLWDVRLFVFVRQGRRDSTPALLRLTVRHNVCAGAFLFLGLRRNGQALPPLHLNGDNT